MGEHYRDPLAHKMTAPLGSLLQTPSEVAGNAVGTAPSASYRDVLIPVKDRWSTGTRIPTTWRCRLFGHRWVYGTPTVPDAHIWDCTRRPKCLRNEVRGHLR